ncbi:UNVERIFIED_CONTAM: hypothetical protein ABIE34_004125 [Jeotgalibacillus campisalis]
MRAGTLPGGLLRVARLVVMKLKVLPGKGAAAESPYRAKAKEG